MRSVKLLGLTTTAAFALSAVLVAPAFATSTNNPHFNVNGVELASGSTENILASANGSQKLESGAGVKPITCTGVSLTGSDFIENNSMGGLDMEVLQYTGCTYETATCKVATKGTSNWGTIETNLLTSRLGWLTKEQAEEELPTNTTLTLFEPTSGSKFVEIEFSGTGCPSLSEAAVTGSVAVMDAGTATTEEVTHELEAPSTPIKKFFYNEGGTTKESKPGLTAFGVTAKYIGKDNVMLESGKTWSVK